MGRWGLLNKTASEGFKAASSAVWAKRNGASIDEAMSFGFAMGGVADNRHSLIHQAQQQSANLAFDNVLHQNYIAGALAGQPSVLHDIWGSLPPQRQKIIEKKIKAELIKQHEFAFTSPSD